MTTKSTQLIFSIGAEPGTDEHELAELTHSLREDLMETDVESVEQVRGAEAPGGSKGGAATLASLAVTLAPTALTGVITMLQSWLTRHERTTITLQRGDGTITVTGTLSPEQQRVIADWLRTEKAA